MKKVFIAVFCGVALAAGASRLAELPAPEQAAIDRISADAMRGNLSFLSSDALEGRGTPSRGLDIAAEFIASRFRSAGLEPLAKNGSYFQTAKFAEVTPKLDDFRMKLKTGGEELELSAENVRVLSLQPLDLKDAPVVNLPADGAVPPIEGKIVAGEARRYGSEAFMNPLQSRRPALILLLSRRAGSSQAHASLEETDSPQAPVIRIINEDALSALAARHDFTISMHLAAPVRRNVALENVAGILRGSDPLLRDQYVVLTAHYDHLGMLPPGNGDRIYNGANDNGSGTVSVMEIANALAALQPHPKRSILFMTFFGEEEGLLGSYYYTHHPLVPLKNTVANINLEQMGRTDEQGGPEVGAFAFTGPSYSDLPATMTAAAKSEGVKIYTKRGADAFFDRSDNYAFALAGVVAHTVVVAFEYPDYHGLGDDWQKIDYANMAKVDRGIAAGVLELANSPGVPQWSRLKEAAQYREAGK